MGAMPNVFSPSLLKKTWVSAFNEYSQQWKELGKEGILSRDVLQLKEKE